MGNNLQNIYRLITALGFNPKKTYYSTKGIFYILRDYRALKTALDNTDTGFSMSRPYLCLADRFEDSGAASGHYFHQDLLIARRIHAAQPQKHVDVGSRVDGFVAHVASFRSIEVLDIRPLDSTIPNVVFTQADMMNPVPENLTNYCDSLSCLHTIEHFGLGRYGDPINAEGHLRGLENLHKILKPGGKLYFSTPVGPQRIEFNAHRVFSLDYLYSYLSENYKIDQFSYVDDAGALHEDMKPSSEEKKNSYGCQYGCGIFELTKH